MYLVHLIYCQTYRNWSIWTCKCLFNYQKREHFHCYDAVLFKLNCLFSLHERCFTIWVKKQWWIEPHHLQTVVYYRHIHLYVCFPLLILCLLAFWILFCFYLILLLFLLFFKFGFGVGESVNALCEISVNNVLFLKLKYYRWLQFLFDLICSIICNISDASVSCWMYVQCFEPELVDFNLEL